MNLHLNLQGNRAGDGMLPCGEEASFERNHLTPEDQVVHLATSGLIYYRSGDHEPGQRLYRAALEQAKRQSNSYLAAMAAYFFAMEGLRSSQPVSLETLGEALELIEAVSAPETEVLHKRLLTEKAQLE